MKQPIVPDRGAVYFFSFPSTGTEGVVLTPPTAVSGRFGAALAAGDFDGDGSADLAVGVPDGQLNSLANRGPVHLVFGGAGGLQSTPGETLSYSSLTGEPIHASDRFGAAFTAGQFDSAPGIDYAIGAPRFDLPGAADAGRVVLVYRDPLFEDGFESGDTTAWN